MHELSLMQSIFEIVEQEMESHDVDHVDRVKLRVGELAAVEESSIRFAFDVLKENTRLQHASLEIVYEPGEAYCSHCDLRYPVPKYRVVCPQCGSGGRIVAGKELYVDSLEVDESERD